MQEWSTTDISGKPAGEYLYPNSVIRCCLLLKISCHLCLRREAGFVEGLLLLPGRGAYAIPGYSTLCRRQSLAPCESSRRLEKGGNPDIAIDSTGLNVYGDDEWKVRRYR